MADAAVVGPLAEPHLAYQVRFAEMRPRRHARFALRRAAKRRVSRARLRSSSPWISRSFRFVEAGADSRNETQAAVGS